MKWFFVILGILLGAVCDGQLPEVRHKVYGTEVRDRVNANDSILYVTLHGSLDSIVGIFDWRDSSVVIINGIQFNTEYVPEEHIEGLLHHNDEDKTLEYGLERGSALQIGQEIHVRCTNKSGEDIGDGKVVFVHGAQGSRPTISLACSLSPICAYNTVGVTTQDIDNNQTGYVTISGLVRDINTSSDTAGSVIWLDSIAGEWTAVRPPAPLDAVVVGMILRQHAEEGIVGVRITSVPRLSYLSDVSVRGNESDWDMLRWNADSARWDTTGGVLRLPNLSEYADNAAALSGGLVAGDLYKTATGDVKVVY